MEKLRSDNTSGFRCITYDCSNKNWKCVYYNENRKLRCKSFSVNKYGEKRALQMALEYRDTIFPRTGQVTL